MRNKIWGEHPSRIVASFGSTHHTPVKTFFEGSMELYALLPYLYTSPALALVSMLMGYVLPSFTRTSHVAEEYAQGLGFWKMEADQNEKSAPVQVMEVDITNFDKAHLQVGLVLSVDDHPVAEKLYVCKVEVANKEIRQVVAGLRKFLPRSDLLDKKVCVILNLKPAKLAGQVSEAMILAGDTQQPGGGEIVRVLEVPPEASVGDLIFLEGGSPSSNPVKQLSSKIWEKIVPLLKVSGGCATFGPRKLVTSAGAVTVADLPDGSGIH